MAFQISGFTKELKGDGARPNLFQVVMTGLPDQAGTSLSFLAKSAQLPGSTLGIAPLYYQGREIKLAGNRTFADWTITIINDEDFKIRNSIERWMNGINSHEGNIRNMAGSGLIAGSAGGFGQAGLNNYISDAKVQQYSKNDTVIKTYDFIGMFPVDLSPIDLDWGTNDSIEEFTVTFAYQYWTTAKTDGTKITT